MTARRILLVDDSPDDRALVIRELSRGFTELRVEPICDMRGLEAALLAGNVDLVVTDNQLGWTDGLEVLRAVKARQPDCPVIMFTGTGNEEVAVLALKAGLDDYVVKGTHELARLGAAARQALERAGNIRAAREVELGYQTFFEHIPVGLFRSTPQGQILTANEALVAMLGYPHRDALLATNAVDLYWDAGDRERWEIALAKESILPGVDLQMRRFDGRPVWVRGSARVTRDEEGRPLYYEASAVDIGDQKSAEAALARRTEEIEALFRALPDLLFRIDASGAFLDYKAGRASDLYVPPDVFQGKRYQDVLPIDVAQEIDKAVRQAQEKASAVVAEYVLPMPQGDQAYEARIVPTLEAQFLVLVRNITERRQLETRLRLAQRMESVGRLAGGIAHDFNNVLNVIMGFSALMLRRLPDGDPLRRHVSEIQKAADRAADLTRQLLAFARQQVLQPRVLDLNALLSNVETMLRRVIGEHIELLARLDPDLGKVSADPGQIEQVVLNLAINARDAMAEGGRITFETRNVDLKAGDADSRVAVAAGPYVLLTIADTGSGMDAETRERVFEPFFTKKSQGTGLGLATVYGVVKQSEGYIFVDSAPGQGSTFRIYLPRVEHGVPTAAPSGSPPLEKVDVPVSETILVVEDEPSLLEVVREVLEEDGYQVLLASGPKEALALVRTDLDRVDLLITDIVMPEMNGRELAARMQALRVGLKVLYMSGYEFDGYGRVSSTEEAFLQKPFTAEVLSRKVRQVLDAGQRNPSA